MKKLATYALTGILVLTIGTTAFASPGRDNSPVNERKPAQFTEAQKADLIKIHGKMLDLQKQKMSKLVEAGAVTKEHADKRIDHMKVRHDEMGKTGQFGPGYGDMGKGKSMRPNRDCPGNHRPVK